MKMPFVSIVVPTYNRGPILYNTLLSLRHQTYPQSRYQVIVVDDGSSDATRELLQSSAKMDNLIPVFNSHQGAAAARNTGVRAAEGELVIFCDSDFIVPANFVQDHVIGHGSHESLALSGMGHWHYMFAYDFGEQWSSFERMHLEPVYNRPIIQERIRSLYPDAHLITEEDIAGKRLEPFIFTPDWLHDWIYNYERMINVFGAGLDHFYLPWLSFCTGNVSILKARLNELGGFDETLQRFEDWELGFRFYQEGGEFRFSTEVEAYQQLTPATPKRSAANLISFQRLCKKHPCLSIRMLQLLLNDLVSFEVLSYILEQHSAIGVEYPSSEIHSYFENMIRLYAAGAEPPLKRWNRPSSNWEGIRQLRSRLSVENRFSHWLDLLNKLEHGFHV